MPETTNAKAAPLSVEHGGAIVRARNLLIMGIAVLQWIPALSLAQAQGTATVDKVIQAYQLDREIEEKKDDLRSRKTTLVTDRSVGDTIAQAIAKINQSQYPPELQQQVADAKSLAISASKPADVKAFVEKLQTIARRYALARVTIDQLIDIDDNTISVDEKKKLRTLLTAGAQQPDVTKADVFSRMLPVEFLLDVDSSDIKKLFPKYPAAVKVNETALDEILSQYSAEKFNASKNAVLQTLVLMQKQLAQSISDDQKGIDAVNADLDKLSERREKSSKVDEALIYYSLPGLALLMIGLLLAPRAYQDQALHLEVFKSGLLLELFTVFFITATILILGLGQRIDGPILGTLLGGIAGYVLGRAGGKGRQAGSTEGG